MPELAEPPVKTAETPAPEINPELRKLFALDIPEPEPTPVAAAPVIEPVKPEPVVPEEVVPAATDDKTKDIRSRLAPDFNAPEIKPAEPAVPDADLVELDAAIEQAPSPKAKADLKKFRDQLATLKTEVQTLKARPAAPVEDVDTQTILAETQKERDDLLLRLERYDLQASPKFQEQYMKPRQQKFEDARQVLKEAGSDPDALPRALSLVGKARIDALEELSESIPQQIMRGRFERLIEGIDNDSKIINEKLADAKRVAAEEAKNETIRRHENNEKAAREWKSLLGAARADLLENVKLEPLQKVGKPGFEWWDNQVDEIDAVAEEILLKSTPQKAAVAAYLAASAGAFRSMFHAERQFNAVLQKENDELKGAEPGLTNDRKPAAVPTDGAEPSDILSRLRSGEYRK